MRPTHAILPIAPALAVLALAGCGSSVPAHAVPAAASISGIPAAATTSHPSRASHATSGQHRVARHVVTLAPKAYAEGGSGADARRARHTVLRGVAASPRPDTRHGRGTYVGPNNDGRSSCGYQNVGPGLEQAEAFVVRGVSCHIARTVATGAKGHIRAGQHYTSHGFACVVRLGGTHGLARYRCSIGDAKVSFVVS